MCGYKWHLHIRHLVAFVCGGLKYKYGSRNECECSGYTESQRLGVVLAEKLGATRLQFLGGEYTKKLVR